jgi:hypothetical protein
MVGLDGSVRSQTRGEIMKSRLIVAVVAVLMVAGCDSPPTVSTTQMIATIPASLRACDPGQKITVAWNAKESGLKAVQVYVVDAKGAEVLFTSSGVLEGSSETGDWAKADLTFVLKNEDGTKELARYTVDSVPCD